MEESKKVFWGIFLFGIILNAVKGSESQIWMFFFGLAIIIYTNGISHNRDYDMPGLLIGGTMVFCSVIFF
jgi:hypothetical protein